MRFCGKTWNVLCCSKICSFANVVTPRKTIVMLDRANNDERFTNKIKYGSMIMMLRQKVQSLMDQ